MPTTSELYLVGKMPLGRISNSFSGKELRVLDRALALLQQQGPPEADYPIGLVAAKIGGMRAKLRERNPRHLFRPKHAPMKEQCVSCPFGKDKRKFGEVMAKLAEANGDPIPAEELEERTQAAIDMIRMEVRGHGEFACHCSAYDENMGLRPMVERRQCPGALRYYMEAGD